MTRVKSGSLLPVASTGTAAGTRTPTPAAVAKPLASPSSRRGSPSRRASPGKTSASRTRSERCVGGWCAAVWLWLWLCGRVAMCVGVCVWMLPTLWLWRCVWRCDIDAFVRRTLQSGPSLDSVAPSPAPAASTAQAGPRRNQPASRSPSKTLSRVSSSGASGARGLTRAASTGDDVGAARTFGSSLTLGSQPSAAEPVRSPRQLELAPSGTPRRANVSGSRSGGDDDEEDDYSDSVDDFEDDDEEYVDLGVDELMAGVGDIGAADALDLSDGSFDEEDPF